MDMPLADAPSASENKLTLRVKLAYGSGDLGAAIVAAVNGFFLNAFLLEVAGLRPGVVGIIFLIAQVWDAITDPLVGTWSDRTRTKWGCKRPWLLFGAVPFGIAMFLNWVVPPLDGDALAIYFLIVALLLRTAFTVVNVPYTAMTPELAPEYDARTSLNAYRFSFSILGGLFAVVLHPVFVGFGGDDVQLGHAISAAVWMLFIILSTLSAFRWTYENEITEEAPKVGFFKSLRLAFTNRPFLFVTGIYLLSWVGLMFIQNNLLLYIRYWGGDEEQFSLYVFLLQITAFICLGMWAYLSERIGKKNVYMTGISIWSLALIGLFLIPQGQTTPYIVVSVFAGMGVSVAYLIPWSMLPDVIEYDELETGERHEGVYYGLFVFLQKLGLSLGLAMSGFALEAAGYINPESADAIVTQPDSVLTMLRLMVSLIPLVIIVLSLPLAYYYPITKERFAEIQAELATRKEKLKNS